MLHICSVLLKITVSPLLQYIVGLHQLRVEADRMIRESVAPSTAKAYAKTIARLVDFCRTHKIKDKLRFAPASIELFVIHMKQGGLGFGAIKSMLSAIRHYCKVNNIAINFDTPRLQLLLRGLKRTQCSKTRVNTHVSLALLKRLCLVAPCCLGNELAIAARALFTLCFFAQTRRSL